MILAYGYSYGYGYYGFDWTYILVLIGVILSMAASARMNSTFQKYTQIRSTSGLTGADVAKKILSANGIYDVTVQPVSGQLTDHYDPRNKTVNLSEVIYASTSVAAIGVAAHECGHAIQDNVSYAPLKFRAAFVPIANIGSKLSWPLIIMGLFLGAMGNIFIQIGIIMFLMAVIFQLVTLPVEFDASKRALVELKVNGILPADEESQAKKVLGAAAMTYVAAAAVSMLQLLRLVLLFGNRGRRR